MKKFFLILFIVSFLAGSVWAWNDQKSATVDHSSVPTAPEMTRATGWFDYFDVADATSLTWATPERATLFEVWDFCLEAPISIDTVSAYFYEHADYLWPDSTFSFKIYAADGTTLLGDSGPLEAVPPAINTFFEVGFVFSTPIAITGDFYLVVAPVDVSGHPSTAGTNLYDGQSYTGDATAGWVLYPQMTYFMSAHMTGADTGERLAVTPETGAFGVVPLGNSTTQTFVIENYCPTGTITLDPAPALTGDAVFTITGDTGATYPTILPTDQTTVEIEVTFAPIAGVPYTGTLEVYDNLTRATTQIPLTGNGLDPDCEWYVVGFDDYGDGWSTGYIEIFFDDVLMYHWSGPQNAAGPDTLHFGIVEGADIDITHVGDTWGYENEYYVYNNFDNLVGSDGVGGVDPIGINDLYGTCIIPPCGFPVDLVTESISATTATLKWSPGPDAEVMWDVIWGDPDFDPLLAGTLISGLSDTTTVLSGLTHSTGYDWYVRADCGASLVSGWGAGDSFYTPPPNDGCQGAINVGEVDSLYFDTTPASISGQGSWVSGTDMWYKYTASGTGTATFDLCGSDFDTMMGIYSGSCLGLTLIEGNDDATYCDARALQSAVLDVPVVHGVSYYIQLGGWSTSVGTGDLTITLNECPDPVDPVVTNITQTTADLAWTEVGTTTNWHVELDTLGFTPTGIPTHTSVANPLLLTGLTAATDYAWYVVSDCTVRDSSVWIGPNVFTTLEACPIPSGLAVLNLTTTTATLDWDTMSGATGYDWEVVLRDSLQGHGVVDSGNLQHSTVDITSLASNTLYDYRVQSVCPDRAVSGWSAPFAFGTPCDVIVAPYLESFENAGAIPDCWTSYSTSGEVWRYNNTNGGHSAPSDHTTGAGYFAWVDDSESPSSNDVTLHSPQVDISGLTYAELAFWLYSDNETFSDATISLDIFDGTTWQVGVWSHTPNTAGWEEFVIDLSTYAGPVEAKFIVDEFNVDYYDDISLDDVHFREQPTCPNPGALTVGNETTTGADLGWTSVDSFFDIFIDVAGAVAPLPATTPTVNDNAGTSYTWTGGTTATAYDWWVRADCGVAGVSEWVMGSTFITLCDMVTAFPYNESFENTIFPPVCWDNVQLNGTGTQLWDRNTTGGSPTCLPIDGAAMARFNCYSYSTGVSALLMTPGFTFPDDQYRVRFNMFRDTGYASNAELVEVYYNTTPDTTGAILLGTVHRSTTLAPVEAAQGWYEYVFNVPAGTSGAGYLGLVGVSAYGNNMYIDNVTVEAIPLLPIFGIAPSTMDFGTVFVNNPTGNQTFTISNVGVDTLRVSAVSITGTDAAQFILTDLNTYPESLSVNTIDVDVAFLPTSVGVKNAFLTVVDDLARASYNIPLTGEGTIPPLGDVISNPFVVGALPYNVTGSTVGFADNYGNYGDASLMTNLLCTDLSYFSTSTLGAGGDVVYEITLATPTQLIIDLCDSGFDTSLALVSGDGTAPEDVLLIDDDSYLPAGQGCDACCQSFLNCSVPVPAGTYYIIVGGYGTNEGDYDLTVSAVTAPTAPTNVVIANDGTNVTITWDAVVGAVSYVVYSSTSPTGTFAADATGVLTGEQWVATTPAVNTFYYVVSTSGGSTDAISITNNEDHSVKGIHVEKIRK